MQICTSLQTDNHASTSLLSFLGTSTYLIQNIVRNLSLFPVVGDLIEFNKIFCARKLEFLLRNDCLIMSSAVSIHCTLKVVVQ